MVRSYTTKEKVDKFVLNVVYSFTYAFLTKFFIPVTYFAVEFVLKLREQVKQQVVIQPVNIPDCIFCHCSVLKKYGARYSKNGNIQRFLCSNCKRTFSINIGFEKMKHNPL